MRRPQVLADSTSRKKSPPKASISLQMWDWGRGDDQATVTTTSRGVPRGHTLLAKWPQTCRVMSQALLLFHRTQLGDICYAAVKN